METNSKVETKTRPAFIKIEENQDGIIKKIECEYSIYVAEKKEGDKYFNFFIPAFNISYFSDKKEDASRMADAAVSVFFDYWVKNQGKGYFLDKIKKLGFTLNKEGESKVKNKIKMRFSVLKPSIPADFKDGIIAPSKKTYDVAA